MKAFLSIPHFEQCARHCIFRLPDLDPTNEARMILAENGETAPADTASHPSLRWLNEHGPAFPGANPNAQALYRDALAASLVCAIDALTALEADAQAEAYGCADADACLVCHECQRIKPCPIHGEARK